MPIATSPDLAFRHDVLTGLRQTRKILPCKYLYDETGSALFDQICGLDEYYPTRTELQIMSENAVSIADQIGAGAVLFWIRCQDCLDVEVVC
ncbi:L-histidine N(alpha)-methyltransferase [Neorhodopirellula pilleata]|uniref:Histidine-specific methyltransferase EgtD n=1 Tax=Neorhodopirellula pilleata TaxID=2714738 RepID=A0A5C6A170_9BACT|nr:L-histidine N(alpha)-methyltransferase [Neorhodopirellula pilleata]TWT93001.1 Histidine-specific methyltransferase EgtD [Neorhodopirellula pilleata]